MPALSFPRSSTPGYRAGEGEGRLINCQLEKTGDTAVMRRLPGLSAFAALGGSGPRGMIELDGSIYAAMAGEVRRRAPDGAVSVLAGVLSGADGVTWARNNRTTAGVSTPDLVVCRSAGGAGVVTPTALTSYPDSDLPATVNSVDFLGGYFLFTLPDARIFATNLNTTDVDALSFATAESRADGLLRGIVSSGRYYAMGGETIEPWINAGLQPFPLARATTVIPIGLLATMAVAGFEVGWGLNPLFVANDGTVHALDGYSTTPVSTTAVERFIADSTVSTLEASVYTFRGHAIWCLSSDRGTWEYNVKIGAWHERLSDGALRWRGSRSLKYGSAWLVGDTLSGKLLTIDEDARTEDGAPLTWTVESGALAEFANKLVAPELFAHFTASTATVAISWSKDGGATWSAPVSRSLAQAGRVAIRVNRLGRSTQHGFRVRFSVSDDADFSFLGAKIDNVQGRRP